jgi:hypothetical protein
VAYPISLIRYQLLKLVEGTIEVPKLITNPRNNGIKATKFFISYQNGTGKKVDTN